MESKRLHVREPFVHTFVLVTVVQFMDLASVRAVLLCGSRQWTDFFGKPASWRIVHTTLMPNLQLAPGSDHWRRSLKETRIKYPLLRPWEVNKRCGTCDQWLPHNKLWCAISQAHFCNRKCKSVPWARARAKFNSNAFV